MKKLKPEIDTPNGKGIIDDIYVSELGYLMIRVYYPESKRWISYNKGNWDDTIKLV